MAVLQSPEKEVNAHSDPNRARVPDGRRECDTLAAALADDKVLI